MDILNVAWSNGLTFAECEHMKQVGVNARFVNESVLNQESLKDLSASGNGNGNGLLFHTTQPTSRSTIKAIAYSKPTISEN